MEITVMTVVWAIAFVGTIFMEAETAELVAIWFMPGAVAALVMSMFNVDIWIQCVVFVALSAILLVLAKIVFKKKFTAKLGSEKTDTDLLIGEKAKVVEDIVNEDNRGAVKLGGQIWSARSEDGEPVAAGEFVTVVKISGVKLICRK